MSYLWIVLAILGVAAIGASMTVIHGYKTSMLLIVLGGVLVQAGIAAFAINYGREKSRYGREKSRSRKRRYEMRTAA